VDQRALCRSDQSLTNARLRGSISSRSQPSEVAASPTTTRARSAWWLSDGETGAAPPSSRASGAPSAAATISTCEIGTPSHRATAVLAVKRPSRQSLRRFSTLSPASTSRSPGLSQLSPGGTSASQRVSQPTEVIA
jgi:hypothetical protein